MNTQYPSTASGPLRRIVLGLVIVVLALAIVGMIYENIAEARDRRFNPMEGKLVEVNGRKMHIDCTGEGSPTVILDAGLGDTFLTWRKIQPQLSKFTRVCSYDRAGLGYSDASAQPRTSKVFAEELHELLGAAAVKPPYVLVGHSMGGYDVRFYASLYPSDVAGMVLVDSSHPEQDQRLPPELKNMEGTWVREAEFVAFSMPFGIPRLLGLCDDDAVRRAADCNFHSALEGLEEMKSFDESAAQTAATGSLGNIPLAVLSHDPEKPSTELPPDLAKPTNAAWEKMQEEMAHLSSRGTQAIVKNSAHYIQIDRPDAVIDAIRAVVDQVRAPAPASRPPTGTR
ncbi:MAG TPA: alpha/beta hydrolase [Candidatus Sulfotelmatobacter sp.]|nr:alpha/beta hydrolase [Candidatus Sulfotelmatobacter sp.]